MALYAILLFISFFTATTMIMTNKTIMNNYGFAFPTFLTSYHFLLGTIFLNTLVKFNFIKKAVNVPTYLRWMMGIYGTMSVVSLNLNLKTNSIGFYQLSKLCNIPSMVIYKYFKFGIKTPFESLVCLAILLFGLCLFFLNDVQFTFIGFIYAAVSVLATTVFQTRATTIQGKYDISGFQYNHIISFPQFIVCFLCALLTETHGNKNILKHEYQLKEVFLILSTGLYAVYGNLVSFIILGKIGPVTFQVIGHTKTILVFIIGSFLFPPTKNETIQQRRRKNIGVIISMIGAILYSYFEVKNKNKKENENEEEKGLLQQRNEEEEEIVFEINSDENELIKENV